MNNTLVIGLTGPTGAGKSEVARLFAQCGAVVIDADVLAHRAVEPDTPAFAALVERFSNDIMKPDGTLDRAALAKRAFATPQDTADLNAIVHPAVIAMMKRDLAAAVEQGARAVVLDVPLLFQAGLESLCDTTVAVIAPPAVRQARICARDGISPDQAAQRMGAQPPADYYRDRAAAVLENTGDREALQSAVTALWGRWMA